MAEVIKMPRLSDTMTEGVVVKWLKNEGETVAEGDMLAEIETDKATMEFESFHSGVLLHIAVKEGNKTDVDNLLAIIGKKGEDISSLISGAGDAETKKESTTKSEPASSESSSSNDELNEKVLTMPRLSDTMTEGTLVKWCKKVGDMVNEGDIIAEIETDKATMEFESFKNGILLFQGLKEGEVAEVDSILAILGTKDDNIDEIKKSFSAKNGGDSSATTESTKTKKEQPASAPETTSTQSNNTSDRVLASPLAKKIAKDKNVDLSQIKTSGEKQRITKKDVEDFIASGQGNQSQSHSPIISNEKTIETPISQMRKTIAKRLSESKFSAPHYYLKMELDMDNMVEYRKKINELQTDYKISYNDLVIKATAIALRKHPKINTTWTADKIITHGQVNIGVAIAVEDGLLVPVIRNTDKTSLKNISTEVKNLASLAKQKKLQPKDWEGSTFAISNLGMYGIDEFTSIINQPNSAILSVGGLKQMPVVKNGNIVAGNVMKVTLACDHRTIDGATAAEFLQTFKKLIENPSLLILE